MKRNVIILVALLLTSQGLLAKKTNKSLTKFTVASWNIGHFALGLSSDTKVKPEEAQAKQMEYRKFLNQVNADILASIEDSPDFVKAVDGKPAIKSRDAIYSCYENAAVGSKLSYNCNSVYSNGFKVEKATEVIFEKCVQKRYYNCVDMEIGGQKVKFVCTHLDWNEGKNGAAYRAIQIQNLIETFKDEPYVIMCADWNTSNSPSEYDPFLQAGYSMANHGYMGDLMTYPAGDCPDTCIDNIIVKGFSLSNIQVYNEPTLSDHCMIKADLLMK